MSQENSTPTTQDPAPQIMVDATPTEERKEISKEEATEFLKEIQEKAGQISESEMEEQNLVNEFFNSLLKILRPFSKTLKISVSSLPEKYKQEISKAHLHLNGQLVLVSRNGEVEILNLAEKDNHELLVEITGEIMAKLESLIDSYKSKTEKRVKFLIPITQQLQKVAKVFSEN